MPSSIFSSSRSIPRERWGAFLIGVAATTVLVLTCVEVKLRARGFEPSTDDSQELWSVARSAADRLDPHGVALVGSSRMVFDVQPSLLASTLRREVIQLAIRNGSPLPVLRDLAEDPNFRGSVICEVYPIRFFGEPLDVPGQRATVFIDAFRHRSFSANIEAVARAHLQSRFAFLLPEVSLRPAVADFLIRHVLPKPPAERGFPDRYRQIDFTGQDLKSGEAFRLHLLENDRAVPTEAQWMARLAQIETWVRAIQARGGRVAFVRLLSAGQERELEDRRFPRATFWDRLVASTSAATFHFEDSETLRGFDAPDGAHVDARDAPAFTRAFAEETERRRLLSPPRAEN